MESWGEAWVDNIPATRGDASGVRHCYYGAECAMKTLSSRIRFAQKSLDLMEFKRMIENFKVVYGIEGEGMIGRAI